MIASARKVLFACFMILSARKILFACFMIASTRKVLFACFMIFHLSFLLYDCLRQEGPFCLLYDFLRQEGTEIRIGNHLRQERAKITRLGDSVCTLGAGYFGAELLVLVQHSFPIGGRCFSSPKQKSCLVHLLLFRARIFSHLLTDACALGTT